MTEIRIVVDLEHPPRRVWRALTDRALLARWLAVNDLEPRAGAEFRLEPPDAAGIDGPVEGELLALDEPRRISMRWHGPELTTLVDWELAPTATGTTLTWRESCVGGEWEAARRDRLEASYRQLLTGRLTAVLDWLAFGEVDFAAAPTAVISTTGEAGRRRGRWLVGAGAAVALGAAAIVAGIALARSESGGPPDVAPEPSRSAPAAPGDPTPSDSGSPAAARSGFTRGAQTGQT